MVLLASGALAGCGAILGVDGDYFEVTDAALQGDATQDDVSQGDARTDARADSGRDSGSAPGIKCGSSTCDPTKKLCCPSGPECKEPGDCSGGVMVECDDEADCVARGTGTVCCATNASDGGAGPIACVASSSDCNNGQRRLCDPAAHTCNCSRDLQRYGMTFHYCD